MLLNFCLIYSWVNTLYSQRPSYILTHLVLPSNLDSFVTQGEMSPTCVGVGRYASLCLKSLWHSTASRMTNTTARTPTHANTSVSLSSFRNEMLIGIFGLSDCNVLFSVKCKTICEKIFFFLGYKVHWGLLDEGESKYPANGNNRLANKVDWSNKSVFPGIISSFPHLRESYVYLSRVIVMPRQSLVAKYFILITKRLRGVYVYI